MSDFVKFAKYQPEAADNEQHYRVIRSSVEALEATAASAEAADGSGSAVCGNSGAGSI